MVNCVVAPFLFASPSPKSTINKARIPIRFLKRVILVFQVIADKELRNAHSSSRDCRPCQKVRYSSRFGPSAALPFFVSQLLQMVADFSRLCPGLNFLEVVPLWSATTITGEVIARPPSHSKVKLQSSPAMFDS
jgi:hypothetical protein